eukprot:SAG11_NODE_680_length_7781_cov_6.490497_11_plen_38_part_00
MINQLKTSFSPVPQQEVPITELLEVHIAYEKSLDQLR